MTGNWKCECGEMRIWKKCSKGLCSRCYRRSRAKTSCVDCGVALKSATAQRCRGCSRRSSSTVATGKCSVCPREGRIVKGMCTTCYSRELRNNKTCVKCGKRVTKLGDDGGCYWCKVAEDSKKKVCIECGKHEATRRPGTRCDECRWRQVKADAAADWPCAKCGEMTPARTPSGRRRPNRLCNTCSKEAAGRAPQTEEYKIAVKRAERTRAKRRLKFAVIDGLGGVCSCCGEARIEFLTADHIHGDGSVHRKESKNVYRDIINLGFPRDQFRVLCMNCNCAIGAWGYCPHGKMEEELVALREARSLVRPEI